MSRRAIGGLATGLLTVVGVLVALVFLRTVIVQEVIERDLRARGVPFERLTVSELGLDTAAVTNVRLGAHGEVTAAALRVEYDLTGLVDGALRRIVLERPTVHLDLTGAGPPLGSLQPLFEGRDGGGGAPELPPIEIVDGTIDARTPIGPITAAVDGTVLIAGSGPTAPLAEADLALAVEGDVGRLAGTADIAIQEDGRIVSDIEVTEGTLTRAEWRAEGITGGARFVWADGRRKDVTATLALEGGAVEATRFRDARLVLEIDETDAKGTVVLTAADNSFTAELHATLSDYLERPGARLKAELAAGVHAPLWPLLRLPAPSEGEVTARLSASGQLPPLRQLAAADFATMQADIPDALQGRLDVTLDGLTFPDGIADITGAIGAQFGLEEQTINLHFAPETHLAATRIEPLWLSARGVPLPIAMRLEEGADLAVDEARTKPPAVSWQPLPNGGRINASGGLRLSLTSGGDARISVAGSTEVGANGKIQSLSLQTVSFSLERQGPAAEPMETVAVAGTLTGTPAALDGDFDATIWLPTLEVASVRAEAAAITLPLHMQRTPTALSLSLREPGRLAAQALAYGGAIETTAPVAAEIATLGLRGETLPGGEATWRHTVRLVPGDVHFRVPAESAGATRFHARIDGIEAEGTLAADGPYEGEITAEIPRLRLIGQDFALDSLVLVSRPGAADGEIVSIEQGTLRNVAKEPYLAPFYLWGDLRGADDRLVFSMGGRTAQGSGRLRLDGSHDLSSGRGAAKLALESVTFAPTGAQPAAVFPTLDDLKGASGRVEGRANLSWGAEGVDGSARLLVDSLSFLLPGAAVRGLDLDLSLSSLVPPASRPGQTLTIGEIDPGLPITDVSVLFEVLRGDRPRASISTARFDIAGGRVSTRDVLIDPTATHRSLTLDVDQVDLAYVFDLLDIQGVSGTGELSGAVPITLEGGEVRIQNGRLAAIGPGVLHLQSDTIRRALGAAGESADLIMRALADFRYDELTLEIATPSPTLAEVNLLLLGNNPAVMDGHPFRFNVNLETDPTRLLATVRDLSQISQRALQRLWMVDR